MKNGIGRVAGWPWLPGIGLEVSGSGSLNRQPGLAEDDDVAGLGAEPQPRRRRSWVASTPGWPRAISRIRRDRRVRAGRPAPVQ